MLEPLKAIKHPKKLEKFIFNPSLGEKNLEKNSYLFLERLMNVLARALKSRKC
jgi:hypothetical protein